MNTVTPVWFLPRCFTIVTFYPIYFISCSLSLCVCVCVCVCVCISMCLDIDTHTHNFFLHNLRAPYIHHGT